MANPTRTIHLPEPGDLRTCTRWACLQRIPGTGPDPTVLTNQVQRAVATVAATVIATAEADGNLQATDQYIHAFLQHFWAGIEALPGPRYPLPLLAVAEERGTRCIETLVERVLPRLQYREQLLTHMLPFEWQIPDGTGGELLFPGVIARLGEDRLTGAIRIYDWQVEESHFPHHECRPPLSTDRRGTGMATESVSRARDRVCRGLPAQGYHLGVDPDAPGAVPP
ncbi:MAG: hypothetical protein M5R38_03805 [Candidatus Methylomirabilis sp.]|nr:hypothetical protein [Candidatus Methylomirabilis sp.]